MCEQTEIPYKEGDVVWVKLGKCFWPGLVKDFDKLSEDILESFKKRPIAAVQFFEEDTYEFVKNLDHISLYNGRKKLDFIKKGLDLFRNQKDASNFMSKFPEDVKKAELLTGGNPDILSDPQFQPKEKSSYRGLFDTSSEKKEKEKTPRPRGRPPASVSANGRRSTPASITQTPTRPITHARFVGGETDHDVRIRQQKSTPLTSSASQQTPKPKTDSPYKCHLCDFTSHRLNVIILHNKFHSGEEAKGPKGKGKGAGKGKAVPKVRTAPSSPSKPKTPIKTKVDEDKSSTPLSKPLSPSPKALVSPKATASPKVGNKRKFIQDYKVDLDEVPAAKVKTRETPEKKPTKTPEKVSEKKPVVLGKRKGTPGVEKPSKKNKNDAEIRDKLLADWDEEDAEKEEMELEMLKKKTASDVSDLNQEVVTTKTSCFDFDDSRDAILDSQLEERAKKFVESRKAPREKVETNQDLARLESNLDTLANASFQSEKSTVESSANADDFDEAINNLLAETSVPALPQVPLVEVCKSSGLLPDVVLDSSAANTNKITVCKSAPMRTSETGAGDHDYSVKKMVIDEILDIDSMPVVMTDDIMFTEEATTSHNTTPDIDLISTPESSNSHHKIVFTDGEIKIPTSVRSVVKAVRTTTSNRSKVLPIKPASLGRTIQTQPLNTGKGASTSKPSFVSKGMAGGNYIIVQSASGQQSRLTLAPTTPETPVAGSSQASGKVVILSKPQGQKVLTPAQKVVTPSQMVLTTGQRLITPGQKVVGTPQRLLTSTGQILTPVNPRGRVPVGAKLTPITSQQMRAMTPVTQQCKIMMKSSQTKVSLPSMQAVRPAKQPVKITAAKPMTNTTIYIQAPQGVPSTSKLLVTTQPKGVPQARMMIHPRPRMPNQPKILQSRSTLQPRIISQRPRLPVTAATQAKSVTPVSLAPAAQKFSPQPVLKKVMAPQKTSAPMQRMTLTKPKALQLAPRSSLKQAVQKASIPSTVASVEPVVSQPPPPLVPLQVPVSQPEIVTLPNTLDSTVITSDQLAHVMASTNQLDAGSGATYVLLTIDEAGNLHPYNNQSLIGYDGSDPSAQTLYIDSSSLETGGDLDNMILTIDNSAMNITDSGSVYDMRLPGASQDILAAALANTDVFQPEVTLQDPMTSCVVDTSALLASIPSTLLLPSLNRVVTTAANVSETSLTLNQPIMSPLEVASNTTSFRVPPSISAQNPPPLYDDTLLSNLNIVSTTPANSVFNTNTESTPPYHPSMPLLSEEAIESRVITTDMPEFSADVEQPSIAYDQLTFQNDLVLSSAPPVAEKTTNLVASDDTTASPMDNEEISRFSEEFAGEIDPSDRLVIVTSSPSETNEATQELAAQSHAEETSIQSDLNSDILTSYLSEPQAEKTQSDGSIIAQSMPLLSDDLAMENSESCHKVDILGDSSQESLILQMETQMDGGER